MKSEVYQGFSYVFPPEASQNEVYEKMVNQLVEDVLMGKSGMLAAIGLAKPIPYLNEVYEKMVNQLVEDVLMGKSGMLAAMGLAKPIPYLVVQEILVWFLLLFARYFQKRGTMDQNLQGLSIFQCLKYIQRKGKEKGLWIDDQTGVIYPCSNQQLKASKRLSFMMFSRLNLLLICYDKFQSSVEFYFDFMSHDSAIVKYDMCIINIRCEIDNFDEDAAAQSSTAMLTIVDLASAEREKRTGNQGTRLVESNFINNTSMVFGLCLRSLLEHQKNRKKPLHKHFQNSLLTKYLRDFLQGKKRMALILTAKSGDEDYQDTSYFLRQAAPYMNIKYETFHNVEEQPANTFGNKRRTQILSKTEQVKRMKLNSNGVCTDDEVRSDILHQPDKGYTKYLHSFVSSFQRKTKNAELSGSSAECPVIIDAEADFDKSLSENATNLSKTARENQILLKFSRALWNVLKECKSKLDANVDEVSSLRYSLTAEKERCSVLETELNLMKASCSCGKEAVAEVEENGSKAKLTDCMVELERYQPIDVLESNTEIYSSHAAILEISADAVDEQVSCSNLCEEEHVDSGLGTSFAEVVSTSLSVQNVEEHSNEKENVSVEYVLFDKEDLKGLADLDLSCEIGDTVTDLAKAVSVSSVLEMSEEKSYEKFGDSSPEVVFDKQELNEVQEREVDGEITGSELSSVVGDEASSTLEEDKREEEEKQVTRSLEVISISSEVEKCVDQSIERFVSEVEYIEADGEITG
ncbi:Kinesin, motor domain-containing protein [Artemisia annua]|uniref:Kinesin, motor domain-containing protein n=1 Tax=Artemisia annua TaxID=35608 RepID=A0A2U1LVQ9_ARTAN|nr:Kinesin, motor domain-containing protein [Artemisia annua]